ncbi:MAG TPA: aminotransferase class V-fold PLP-dependent enzyme [Rhizomicrobium sp.]|jgi:isopenicillin-N epimerase|nr:aminotransferase class V-fold PLP-dependent enzyme [Rhizomicrobium sp.]
MTSHSPWDRSPSIEGHAALSAFQLAPDRIHLNHGSYGAVPLRVLAEQERIRAHIERDPTSFFQDELPGALRAMASKVAARFGGAAQDWVFCENATSAVNGVLASFPLQPGDEIVTTSHVYGAVLKAMAVWAARKGAHLVIADLPAISQSDDQVVEDIAAVLTPRSRLLIVDHITSATATIFPVRRIVERAHRQGVAVLVDGAHAPGHVELDVPAIGADWYTGNAHKWLFAPRGCGILWTAPDRQGETLPAILSHGTDAGYVPAFDWIGTRDVTPWLAFAAGGEAHDAFGGANRIARNRAMAAVGGRLIAEGLGAKCSAPESMRGAMMAILLKQTVPYPQFPAEFRQALAQNYRIIAPVSQFMDCLWLRVSAQLYNEADDYRRCLAACLELQDGLFHAQFQ